MMKTLSALFLTILSNAASAQLISQGNGALPACGQRCAGLMSPQSQCGSSWACFCSRVWASSNGILASVCASSCPNPADNAAVSAWYAANCGSDNGASEHPAGGGGGSPSASASAPSASASSTGVDSGTSSGSSCGGSWWDCHWQWIVMIIVIAIGLCILGFGGRWLKKRHDRKQDRTRQGFNTGITSRSAPVDDDKAGGSSSDSAAAFEAGGGRDSPARTREAFMPYGYGYTRSEPWNGDGRVSPITQGGTPFEDMEKGEPPSLSAGDSSAQGKLRRVMVRERSLR